MCRMTAPAGGRPELAVSTSCDESPSEAAAPCVRPILWKSWSWAVGGVRAWFRWLKVRYGPRYTRAMVGTAFVTAFFPVPGSLVVGVAAVVLVAEAHRAIGRAVRRHRMAVIERLTGSDQMKAKGHAMPTRCDVIVAWDATPEQLTVIGTALWRWCVRGVGDHDIYQYLDNQPLADLIAGRFPRPGQVSEPIDRRGLHFRVWDRASQDCGAAIESFQREIPAVGVVEVLVDGISWRRVG
jgi:hypothetical protein